MNLLVIEGDTVIGKALEIGGVVIVTDCHQ